MSKKDCQAIARAIYQAKQSFLAAGENTGRIHDCLTGVEQTERRIAVALSADNPRFDRARFLEACETGTTRGMRK